MVGPQFIHLQTFSRRPNAIGQSVEQVLGEAERRPDVCRHVALPQMPELVAGMSLPELRAAHDAMVAGASTTVRQSGCVRHCAIRRDRRTLMTAIASYPLTWHQVGHSGYALANLEAWEQATVTWARQHFGAHFASVMRHRDETYPHLHVFALPWGLEGIDASLLHVGATAKRETLRQLLADGVPKREALRAANLSYREAMRQLQDEFYRAVGEPCGLARTGSRRQRLTRSEWQARKREAQLRKERLSLIEARETLAEDRALELDLRSRDQDARDYEQDAREGAMMAREDALALAVRLVAEGRLRTLDGRVRAPVEHREALSLVWPQIGPAIRELISLRDRWQSDRARVLDLLRESRLPADLRSEVAQIVRSGA